MNRRRSARLGQVVGLALLLATGVVSAQESGSPSDPATTEVSSKDKETARQLGIDALSALDAREYERAAKLFESAATLYDAPTLRIGRAEALIQLGRLMEAAYEFDTASRSEPLPDEPEAFPHARIEARKRATALRQEIPVLTVTVTGGADARIWVDDEEWQAESGNPGLLDPGKHRLRVVSGSETVKREFVVAPGEQPEILVELKGSSSQQGPTTKSAKVPAPVKPTRRSSRGAAIATTVVGAVAGAAAIVTGLAFLGYRELYREANTPEESMDEKKSLRSTTKGLGWANTICTGVAIVSGGTSIYLWTRPSAEVGQRVDYPSGLVAGLSGSF